MKKYILGCVVALLSAGVFAQTKSETFVLRGTGATVYNSEGKAQFRADQDFILEYASNHDRKIYDWNADVRLVRIDAKGGTSLWLSCNDLMPIEGKCVAPLPSPTRQGATRGPSINSAVPMCPGDPRCPRF